MVERDRTGGRKERKIEIRRERLRERDGKAKEHRMFSKENNSFINKQQLRSSIYTSPLKGGREEC